MHGARTSTASVAAALHDVASLGGFFALQVGGRDDGRHPVARSCAVGFTDLAAAVGHHPVMESAIEPSGGKKSRCAT